MSQKQADYKSKKHFADNIKKISEIVFPITVCIGAILYVSTVFSSDVKLSASLNGETVGYVDSTAVFSYADSRLEATLDEVTDGNYNPDFNISYDLVHTNSCSTLKESDAVALLWSKIENDFTEAYVLYVDDKQVAANTSGASLEALIDEIESGLLATAGNVFGDVKISNCLRIEKRLCLKSMIKSLDEINEMLNPLCDSETDAPPETESFHETVIARVSAPTFASPELTPELTPELSEHNVDRDDLKLDYNFVNTVTLNEAIHFKTEYVEDPYTFAGNQRITQNGSDGAKTVTYEILYDTDGNIIGRNAISESVITQAVNEIITVGTAEFPDAVSTGSLIWPCAQPKGISSYYGWRYLYGKPDFHLGIDIPDDIGSPIWAADGGEVVWAGYTYSYGNSVRIQHADGVMTVYAHLETMSVSVGDKVYKGQNLGTMGRTGVATGTHLHFEVRINNQTTNPIKYLPEI